MAVVLFFRFLTRDKGRCLIDLRYVTILPHNVPFPTDGYIYIKLN